MIIERTINNDGIRLQIHIELTATELREAYDECQRAYRLEDIRNHLNDLPEADLSGFSVAEIVDNPELMGAILQSFFKHESCELAENDVMDECIRTVLAEHIRKKGKVG